MPHDYPVPVEDLVLNPARREGLERQLTAMPAVACTSWLRGACFNVQPDGAQGLFMPHLSEDVVVAFIRKCPPDARAILRERFTRFGWARGLELLDSL